MAGNTPVYGFPYPEPTDLVADYPALGQQLAEDIEGVLPTLGGMTLLNPTSIANSGGSASNSNGSITFTGVTSISVNGVFSSTYDNYRIVITNMAQSVQGNLRMRMRLSGTDNTTANYSDQYFAADGTSTGVNRETGQTSGRIAFLGTNVPQALSMDIYYPAEATSTSWTSFVQGNIGNPFTILHAGWHAVTTAYDGFTLIGQAGTTQGLIRVYGYKGA